MARELGREEGRSWWVGNSTSGGYAVPSGTALVLLAHCLLLHTHPPMDPSHGCKDGCANSAACPLGGDTSLLIVPRGASAPSRSNTLSLLWAAPGTCSAHDHQQSIRILLFHLCPSFQQSVKSLMAWPSPEKSPSMEKEKGVGTVQSSPRFILLMNS